MAGNAIENTLYDRLFDAITQQSKAETEYYRIRGKNIRPILYDIVMSWGTDFKGSRVISEIIKLLKENLVNEIKRLYIFR